MRKFGDISVCISVFQLFVFVLISTFVFLCISIHIHCSANISLYWWLGGAGAGKEAISLLTSHSHRCRQLFVQFSLSGALKIFFQSSLSGAFIQFSLSWALKIFFQSSLGCFDKGGHNIMSNSAVRGNAWFSQGGRGGTEQSFFPGIPDGKQLSWLM